MLRQASITKRQKCILSFAKIAEEEGFTDIAREFRGAAGVEKEHEKRYLALSDNITDGKVFERTTEVLWQCINCGHIQNNAARKNARYASIRKAYFQLDGRQLIKILDKKELRLFYFALLFCLQP